MDPPSDSSNWVRKIRRFSRIMILIKPMELHAYPDAAAFLEATQASLETDEVANSLMLGLSLQLARAPMQFGSQPYLRAVMDPAGLALAALMTPPHNLILYSRPAADPAPAIRILADSLNAQGYTLPGVLAPSGLSGAFAGRWTEISGAQPKAGRRQRLMALSEVLAPPPPSGRLRIAELADLDLAARWRDEFQIDLSGVGDPATSRRDIEPHLLDGDVFFWEDPTPVSVAMKNRPTRTGISISYVYTPPEFRRKGYASACVAGLSRQLLRSGWKTCALFVDLDNPTACHIYQAIGYQPVGEYAEVTFAR